MERILRKLFHGAWPADAAAGPQCRDCSAVAEHRQLMILPASTGAAGAEILTCGAGETNTSIAKCMGLTDMTAGKWRKRYRDLDLEGLHGKLRSGRPRTYEGGQAAGGVRPEISELAKGAATTVSLWESRKRH